LKGKRDYKSMSSVSKSGELQEVLDWGIGRSEEGEEC